MNKCSGCIVPRWLLLTESRLAACSDSRHQIEGTGQSLVNTSPCTPLLSLAATIVAALWCVVRNSTIGPRIKLPQNKPQIISTREESDGRGAVPSQCTLLQLVVLLHPKLALLTVVVLAVQRTVTSPPPPLAAFILPTNVLSTTARCSAATNSRVRHSSTAVSCSGSFPASFLLHPNNHLHSTLAFTRLLLVVYPEPPPPTTPAPPSQYCQFIFGNSATGTDSNS